MCFFLQSLGEFDEAYKNLFGQQDSGEFEDSEGYSEGYSEHWGWIITLDSVSNGRREMWDYWTEMGIVQFLNYLSFIKDKNKHEREMIEQEKRKR